MTANPEQSIKRLRERIDEVEDMSEDDADVLRRMSDRIRILGPSKYSDFAREKYLMRAVKMAQEVGGLADALEDLATCTTDIDLWIKDNPRIERLKRDRKLEQAAVDND